MRNASTVTVCAGSALKNGRIGSAAPSSEVAPRDEDEARGDGLGGRQRDLDALVLAAPEEDGVARRVPARRARIEHVGAGRELDGHRKIDRATLVLHATSVGLKAHRGEQDARSRRHGRHREMGRRRAARARRDPSSSTRATRAARSRATSGS